MTTGEGNYRRVGGGVIYLFEFSKMLAIRSLALLYFEKFCCRFNADLAKVMKFFRNTGATAASSPSFFLQVGGGAGEDTGEREEGEKSQVNSDTALK